MPDFRLIFIHHRIFEFSSAAHTAYEGRLHMIRNISLTGLTIATLTSAIVSRHNKSFVISLVTTFNINYCHISIYEILWCIFCFYFLKIPYCSQASANILPRSIIHTSGHHARIIFFRRKRFIDTFSSMHLIMRIPPPASVMHGLVSKMPLI